MILEALVIKGVCGLVHWGVSHASGAVVAHLAHAATSMTVQQIATTVAVTGFVAGGVMWTVERIDNIRNAALALENGQYKKAAKEIGMFLLLTNLDIKLLPDAINDNLDKLHLPSRKVKAVTEFIKNNEIAIAKYMVSK